jgi:hypothetical protein
MALGFLPHRDRMLREIDHWITLRRLDTLQGICDSCVYSMFDFILTRECRTCSVRMGMLAIMDAGNEEHIHKQENAV